MLNTVIAIAFVILAVAVLIAALAFATFVFALRPVKQKSKTTSTPRWHPVDLDESRNLDNEMQSLLQRDMQALQQPMVRRPPRRL